MLIDEEEKEKIARETREIIERFSSALINVQTEESETVGGFDRREEGEGEEMDKSFREFMFNNANTKNKDFIIAERKSW